MKALIIEAATKKFGQVVEYGNNVLLIKRGNGIFANPDAKFMTIKAAVNENGVGFHDGHYDMDLGNATVSFYARSGHDSDNKYIKQATKSVRDFSNDLVQFPRLLSGIAANISISDEDIDVLCEAMDLEASEVKALFERAHTVWQEDKRYVKNF